jgi:NTE family protein
MTNATQLKPGIGLALSGGGFRATLFHIGSLWRLNDLGLLPQLSEVTSVSGGSITAGWLGHQWKHLAFDGRGVAANFEDAVVKPLRELCSHTIDVDTILGGVLSPFRHPSELLAKGYDEHLFHGATLQALPKKSEGPRFTIYATSLQTGVSVRFAQPYMAEYRIGQIREPDVSLARAVAASSAFPPPLCPVTLELDSAKWKPFDDGKKPELYDRLELREKMLLADGGIYDNLGLERVAGKYERVLASDAGAPFEVFTDSRMVRWSQLARTKRTLDVMSSQIRALRTRELIDGFEAKPGSGAYWGIGTRIDAYALAEQGRPPALVSDNKCTARLSQIRTRLNRFKDREQGQLINWGYALSDAALRRYMLPQDAEAPRGWPVATHPL